MICKFSVALLAIALVSRVGLAQDEHAIPKGPGPRFITVRSLDQAKGEVVFDIQIITEIQGAIGGSGPRVAYVYPNMGLKVSLKTAKWSRADGKRVELGATTKRLKPGMMVLLSADGTPWMKRIYVCSRRTHSC